MSEFTDRVADALIYFEEQGYTHHIQNNFKIGGTVGGNFYTLLKGVTDDRPIVVSNVRSISLSKKTYISSVVSFKEWIWANDELKTAIRRIVSSDEELENIKIIGGGISTTIEIKESEVRLQKIKSLCDICRKFNSRNLGCHISLKYNEVDGIDILLVKNSKVYNVDEILPEIQNHFEIEEYGTDNVDKWENQIVAKLRSDKIKVNDRTFSLYE